jgi:pyruvate formate lyase activating enzyme
MSEAGLHPDQGVIFDVQRFCVHDGPGIRTVVFFKGCALECVWCQNPEGRRHAPELSYHADRCVPGCSKCVSVCPEGAILDQIEGRVDWDKCTHCGECVSVCPSTALSMVGRTWAVDELLAELLADRPFYETSGGGVTLSGGEPVLHAKFLAELLPKLKAEGVHLTLETSGHYPWKLLEPLLPQLDLVLFDVKAGGRERHLKLIGEGDEQIQANLERLLDHSRRAGSPRVEVRMPVVPGYNDGDESLDLLAEHLRELGVEAITLLPYNHLWEAKLSYLDSSKQALGLHVDDDRVYDRVLERFDERGIAASLMA